MEIVPISLPPGETRAVGIPFNRRNVEEWSRLDKLTGMMEKTKIETDHWSASDSKAKHNYGKVVDSRERNRPDGSLQQRQRKQMEIFQTMVPGGSMQVIRSQTVTTSSSSNNWSSTTAKHFDGLQLPVNALDLGHQKTKGSVGRSGSMSSRRPPSRPRSLVTHGGIFNEVASECHRIHEEAKARMFGTYTNGFHDDRPESPGGVVITELDSPSETPSKTNLSRQKSCSNEHVNEETEENNSIRRTSRFRRSLQLPKSSAADDFPDWTNGKSLKERAAEIENLLRCGSSTTTTYGNHRESEPSEIIEKETKTKNSFVTAQTLKEVRERLRRSSVSSDNEAKDDGIVVETNRVKDFVSGMEAKLAPSKMIVNGTGSLESRTTRNQSHHTSEWYRRRKSYGFEKVDEPEKLKSQSNGESSTDSGFGQSTDSGIKINDSPFRRYIPEPNDVAWNRKSPLPSRERSSLRCTKNPWISQLRGTKLVDRQWYNDTPDPEQNDSGVPDSPKSRDEDTKIFDFENNQKKQKKVEFCKTEVHFAAESGRFNIVETDGKPPPNNMVRKKRRNTAPFSTSEVASGLPELKFGDTAFEKKLLTSNAEKIDSLSQKIESELKELSKIVVEALPTKEEDPVKPSHLPKLYDVEEELHDSNDISKPRSILKGIHTEVLESNNRTPLWKSTVVLRNKRFEDVKQKTEDRKSYSSDGESELQIRFRNMRRTEVEPENIEPVTVEIKRRSLPDDVLLNNTRLKPVNLIIDDCEVMDVSKMSVAERIKKVEELKSFNYSSKIDFRSGEATVLQNGTSGIGGDKKEPSVNRNNFPLDSKTLSNPSMKRFSTSDVPNTTTRISINIPCEKSEPQPKNKPFRSWSFAAKTPAYDTPQSTSLVMQTIPATETANSTKLVHNMVSKFDSLAKRVRGKEQRWKTMPINYKAPKVYTHADLEEELRNFTEDLDKDFKDIYEEEIGSLKGSCNDLKKIFEQVYEDKPVKSYCDKANTLPLASSVKLRSDKNQKGVNTSRNPVVNGSSVKYNGYTPAPATQANKKLYDRSKIPPNYESDDSDLLADEEVRSYMSAGNGASDSDTCENHIGERKKSFERIRLQFKKLEERSSFRRKESKVRSELPLKSTLVELNKTAKQQPEPHYIAPPKVASISLRYEDDPTFSNTSTYNGTSTKHRTEERWEKTSNSSTMSDRPRERVSYLNGPSLSEKYSKKSANSSLDNLYEIASLSKVKDVESSSLRRSFRSEDSSSSRRVLRSETKKTEVQESLVDDAVSTLDELSRAADEILVAVNGMTDDSQVSSSDDDGDMSRKIIRKGNVGNLSTISEKSSSTQRRTSLDDDKKEGRDKALSSRATRLLMRANFREAYIGQRSSSEDIATNTEQPRKKLVRKPRPTPVKVEKEEKVCSRVKTRTKRDETDPTVPRERCKTVSSAAKEVTKVHSKTYPLTSDRLDRIERTKPSQRRELLSKADAIAEQSTRKKRTTAPTTPREDSQQPSSISKKRGTRMNLRKVETAKMGQAV